MRRKETEELEFVEKPLEVCPSGSTQGSIQRPNEAASCYTFVNADTCKTNVNENSSNQEETERPESNDVQLSLEPEANAEEENQNVSSETKKKQTYGTCDSNSKSSNEGAKAEHKPSKFDDILATLKELEQDVNLAELSQVNGNCFILG